jgi:hypothetical protein
MNDPRCGHGEALLHIADQNRLIAELREALRLCIIQLEIVLPESGRGNDEIHALRAAYSAIKKTNMGIK